MKKQPAINDLLKVMAKLRSPKGCPWDREQSHLTLRRHAIEEVYELIDAIEARDDHEMAEELGDLLLQVVFHCQLARERGAFDFEKVTRHLVDKLIRRHPHVFGTTKVKNVDEVWANWEKIKKRGKSTARNMRTQIGAGRNSETSAGAAARGKTFEEGAQGETALRTEKISKRNLRRQRWRKNFLNWRRSPNCAAGARKNCWPVKSKNRNGSCADGNKPICQKSGIDSFWKSGLMPDPLRENNFMYAVLETGSKQYRVAAGDKLEIERLEVEAGKPVTFDRVLLVNNDGKLAVGAPTVSGATVVADVVEHKRGETQAHVQDETPQGLSQNHRPSSGTDGRQDHGNQLLIFYGT